MLVIYSSGILLALALFRNYHPYASDFLQLSYLASILYGMIFAVMINVGCLYLYRLYRMHKERRLKEEMTLIKKFNDLVYGEMSALQKGIHRVAIHQKECVNEVTRRYRNALRSQEIVPSLDDFRVISDASDAPDRVLKASELTMEVMKGLEQKILNNPAEKLEVEHCLTETLSKSYTRVYIDEAMSWSVPYPFSFYGRSELLYYVILNLLENAQIATRLAYKHFKRRPVYELFTQASTEEGIAGLIVVKDNGVGIPRDQVPLLFNRFCSIKREKSHIDWPKGSGLGLYFCKKALESFGGTIRCDSKENEYTRFFILLPEYELHAYRNVRPFPIAQSLS